MMGDARDAPYSLRLVRTWFGTTSAGSQGCNFFAYKGLYTAGTPKIAWTARTGGLAGSAVATNADGSRIFAYDRLGQLNCFDKNLGALCVGWTARYYATGTAALDPCAMNATTTPCTAQLSSPWPITVAPSSWPI